MREKKVTCIVCPIGCEITVCGQEDGTIVSIQGHTCPRGETYAREEFLRPVRILTTTAVVKGAEDTPLLAVRSDRPIPKDLLFDAMDQIRALQLAAPVKRGTVLIENILNTGANIIASGEA